MMGSRGNMILAFVAAAGLGACSDDAPKLMNIRTDTPDEFRILPTKPLEAPEDYTALPEPTPGGVNRVDVNPQADAVAALGGKPESMGGGIRAADQGLVNYAVRYGAPANIRETVAAEDLTWRQENNGRLLERLFDINVYFDSYAPMSLDQHAELERLWSRGVRTPSAPPDPLVTIE